MRASAPVPAGGLLFSVPQALLLTAGSAAASARCGELVRRAELNEWASLVLHLLCERAAGADSAWAPYLALLGDQADHPLLWPDDARAQLAGSSALRTLEARRRQVADDAALLVQAGANELPVAAAWRQATGGGAPLVDAASVAWAAAVLLDRGFALDMSEPDLPAEGDMSFYGSWAAHGPAALALVPVADMCRHGGDDARDAVLQYDAAARAAVRAAGADLAAGDEVVDCHGIGLSPGDLLLDHGVAGAAGDAGGTPRYDAPLELAPRGPRNAALLAALQALTGSPPVVAFTPTGPDALDLALLRAALASDAELVSSGWRLTSKAGDEAAAARAMGRLSSPLSAATEAAVVAALSAAVDAAVAAFPTSLERHEEELARLYAAPQPAAGSASERARRLAVLRVLVSEQTALAGSRAVLAEWAAALSKAGRGATPAQLAAVYGFDSDDE